MYPPQDVDLTRIDLNLLVIFDVLMQERSVSRSAQVLHKTPSAVSHALARLREQLDNPLLVKRGSLMQATPEAEALWPGVKHSLHGVRALLRKSRTFDPATSSIVVRFAMADVHPLLFARVYGALHAAAPFARLVWRPASDSTLAEVADGDLDLAVMPAPQYSPDGVFAEHLFSLRWKCGMRREHPDAQRWSAAAYAAASHLSVQTGDRLSAPVLERTERDGLGRKISLVVPQFAAVPNLLANSDLIATMPRMMLLGMARTHDLVLHDVPFEIPPLGITMYRSKRTDSDRGIRWAAEILRNAILTLFGETCRQFGAEWPANPERII